MNDFSLLRSMLNDVRTLNDMRIGSRPVASKLPADQGSARTVRPGGRSDLVARVPGVSVIVDHGVWRRAEETSHEVRIDIGFLVAIQGDFLFSGLEAEQYVTVNGRPCLGGLELLEDQSRIDVRFGPGVGAANRRVELRFTYRRQGPPIKFALSHTSPVRCAYSGTPLAGLAAIRCPRCFALHDTEVWRCELAERCPMCRWTNRGAESWLLDL